VALEREHNNAFAAAFDAVVDRCGFKVDEIVPPAAIAALSECIGRPPCALRLKARANGRHTGKWIRVCLSAPHLGSVYCSPSEF
jgi:hypothetical protein